MISSELELSHLDARHWRNGWRLLVPPRVLDAPAWALVVVDRAPPNVISVVVAGTGARGRIGSPPPLHATDSETLAAYATQLGVGSVIVIDQALIAQLSAEIEGALQLADRGPADQSGKMKDRGPADQSGKMKDRGPADQSGKMIDGVAQALLALKALKHHAGKGVWTEPPLLDILPAPSYEPIQRTFDLLVPDRSALLAYVIEDDRTRVHTSIIATKEDGDITRAATHRAIVDLVPEAALARDWPQHYKRVLAATEERFAKPSIGLFLERATLIKILTGPSDTLARELNAKRVVIDPAPAWLLGLLGGAAVAAMAGRAAAALAAMLPQATRERASALAHRAQAVMKESGAHPFALLGFDPIELWHRLRHHYRP